MRETGRGRRSLRRIAGVVWITAWLGLLYLFVAPWHELGGLVSERLRWLEWFSLLSGLVLGFCVGGIGREVVRPAIGRTYPRLLRWLLYPPALLTVGVLLVLTALERPDPIGTAVTGFLAYWAGLDLSFGIVPLLEGHPPGHPFEPCPEESEDETEFVGVL